MLRQGIDERASLEDLPLNYDSLLVHRRIDLELRVYLTREPYPRIVEFSERKGLRFSDARRMKGR